MKTLLLLVERHKDLATIIIAVVSMVGTIGGAVCVALKYLRDRRDARIANDLSLRRDAYFNLFTAIPLQQIALRKYLTPSMAEPFEQPREGAIALHKLHLLASQEALQCIIERNAIYNNAVMQLTTMKYSAVRLDEERLRLDPEINNLLAKYAATSGDGKAAVQEEMRAHGRRIEEADAARKEAWDSFIKYFESTVRDLSDNYLRLLPLARKDIGLVGTMDAILVTMEKDKEMALATFKRSIDAFRQGRSLRQ